LKTGWTQSVKAFAKTSRFNRRPYYTVRNSGTPANLFFRNEARHESRRYENRNISHGEFLSSTPAARPGRLPLTSYTATLGQVSRNRHHDCRTRFCYSNFAHERKGVDCGEGERQRRTLRP